METELNTLITNLEAVDSTNAPLWAITLIDSMKGLFNILINLKELAKKVELLESVNAVTAQTPNVLKPPIASVQTFCTNLSGEFCQIVWHFIVPTRNQRSPLSGKNMGSSIGCPVDDGAGEVP